VLAALDKCGVPYHVNPRLVRGLDYYTRTTFEFTHGGLGAQNALLGGGRYDGLSEALGGPKAPGIGFAIGEDRLILTLRAQIEGSGQSFDQQLDILAGPRAEYFIAPMGQNLNSEALTLARDLRNVAKQTYLRIEVGEGSFRLKKSFEMANKLAHNIVILGENEVQAGNVTVKHFGSGTQETIPRSELIDRFRKKAERRYQTIQNA